MTPEQLGFKEFVGTVSLQRSAGAIPSHAVPDERSSRSIDMFSTAIRALILVQQQYGWTLDELHSKTDQAMRRFLMEHQDTEKNIGRREMLGFLVGLPVALTGLNIAGDARSTSVEEMLPLYCKLS